MKLTLTLNDKEVAKMSNSEVIEEFEKAERFLVMAVGDSKTSSDKSNVKFLSHGVGKGEMLQGLAIALGKLNLLDEMIESILRYKHGNARFEEMEKLAMKAIADNFRCDSTKH